MEPKVNYTAVGAFVVILLIALIIVITWLSSGLSNKSYQNYLIYMNESVAGLNIDSPVKYNGVNVGSVKQISLNTQNPQQVVLLVNIETNTPITQDTRAVLNIQGLTGVAFIALKNIGFDTQPLKKTPGVKYPVIQSMPSLFNRLDSALTILMKNLSQMSKSIDKAFDNENQQAFKETLKNLNTLSKNLTNQTLPATNQLLNTLQNASDNFVAISTAIKQNPAIVIRGETAPALGPGEK
jgi:phospholipid/cholesterol/gamma-HCH transport system substrate-binding protein